MIFIRGDTMKKERIESLKSLGVDLDETLERFVGNEDLYFKCLNKFLNDKNYGHLMEAIKDEDSSEAFEAAHALKGVSANLGLDNLYEEMKVITEVFRAGSLDYDPDNFEKMKQEYKRAMNTIEGFK
jgi:HPt (histidine-containing phosphotransfer) domain-containing protein